jgi:hypothetical protein
MNLKLRGNLNGSFSHVRSLYKSYYITLLIMLEGLVHIGDP